MLSNDDLLVFYERSIREVYRYAARLTGRDRPWAEELVQETFLALVRQHRAGTLESVDVGWAIQTCRHRFLDELRSRRRRADRERRAYERPVAVGGADAQVGSQGDVADAMADLPVDQRAALVLRHVDGLSVPEVAAALGRSVHATESLLVRGRASLRDRLAEGGR